jgi:hypothetical protein
LPLPDPECLMFLPIEPALRHVRDEMKTWSSRRAPA